MVGSEYVFEKNSDPDLNLKKRSNPDQYFEKGRIRIRILKKFGSGSVFEKVGFGLPTAKDNTVYSIIFAYSILRYAFEVL